MTHRIERCVGALSGLFDGLLDLSRLDAGVVQPQWQTVALPDLLAGLVEEAEAEAARKGLHLSLRLPRCANLPCTRSDPLLLQRLLKYTERGSVMLALRARRQGWCIEVRDSGMGIAQELQPRVFDEFVQGHNPARQRDQGLGLGLAIVARLARVLDHHLSLRSAPGRGTTVALQLSAAPAAAADALQAPVTTPALGLRVVVIDDDAETQAALKDLLALWGCQAVTADSAQGLAVEAGWQPDAAIVDYRLPQGRDGLGEIRWLRQRWGQALPCLLVTGETSPELLVQLQQSHQAWAAKPLAAHLLRQWLATATHRPQVTGIKRAT
jgi:CheY-like chemotaxis protein